MVSLIVILIRLLVPISILRWPFAGMVASLTVDAVEVIILDAAGLGVFAYFGQQIDKALDTYYLAFAVAVSLRWQDKLAKRASISLFFWRLAGVIAFEITKIRQMLFFAPNIFENFYLLVAGSQKFFPAFRVDSGKKLAILLIIAAIPKIIQEYVMHFLEFQTWSFVKHNIFRWR